MAATGVRRKSVGRLEGNFVPGRPLFKAECPPPGPAARCGQKRQPRTRPIANPVPPRSDDVFRGGVESPRTFSSSPPPLPPETNALRKRRHAKKNKIIKKNVFICHVGGHFLR
ncbi:hypothetical protein CDAR_473381 [Caerostris darwini]|uniref:Uncharacterized protein n=1 Tax=Caerostris darwini TaxID=1538125 RepID=A0AAV4TX71_9ARAC|nr:hypothetical protein CDAR_473381 [Caerostris darwini]